MNLITSSNLDLVIISLQSKVAKKHIEFHIFWDHHVVNLHRIRSLGNLHLKVKPEKGPIRNIHTIIGSWNHTTLV